MSFTVIPNDNWEEEVRQRTRGDTDNNTPHQHVPPDILFYFMISRQSFDNNHNLLASTVRTFFSTSEALLIPRRNSELHNIRNGIAATRPIRVEEGIANNFIWHFRLGIYSRIDVTTISSRQRPHFVPRTLGINRVDFIERSF